MVYQMFADYLKIRGINAFYPIPGDADTFIEGTFICIEGEFIMNKDIHKTQYRRILQKYQSRLKE